VQNQIFQGIKAPSSHASYLNVKFLDGIPRHAALPEGMRSRQQFNSSAGSLAKSRHVRSNAGVERGFLSCKDFRHGRGAAMREGIIFDESAADRPRICAHCVSFIKEQAFKFLEAICLVSKAR
jgi:hypothetical protein